MAIYPFSRIILSSSFSTTINTYKSVCKVQNLAQFSLTVCNWIKLDLLYFKINKLLVFSILRSLTGQVKVDLFWSF